MIRSILPLLLGAALFTAGLAGCDDKAKATSESASAKPKSSGAAPASSGAPAANTAAPKDPPKDPPKKDDSGW